MLPQAPNRPGNCAGELEFWRFCGGSKCVSVHTGPSGHIYICAKAYAYTCVCNVNEDMLFMQGGRYLNTYICV